MTVVFPFYQGDARDLIRLLKWIEVLGGTKSHDAILCADAATPFAMVWQIRDLAVRLFKTVRVINTPGTVSGWPQGANALFRCAAEYIQTNQLGPWLWCETDCIPLKKDWLTQLEEEYYGEGKQILGTIVPCDKPGLPAQHVSGCAIYPENLYSLTKSILEQTPNVAFDLAIASVAVPLAENDHLFQCFWGEQDLPPTFIAAAHLKKHPNEFTLDQIKPDSVLFHRNKDGTLIALLKNKLMPGSTAIVQPQGQFIVVLPFNNKDAPLQIECLKWMDEMGQVRQYDCLLSYDHATIAPFVEQANKQARLVFRNVWALCYPNPPRPTWPQAPNWAFQQAGRHIYLKIHRPWLWKEADMIPLKPDWIEQLQQEYQQCGKPFMGSVVPGMGHANGTSVFPADMPARCPSAMKCADAAFDTAMMKDMIPHCHDSIRLMQHIWGVANGKPHVQIGEPIHFSTPEQVQAWVEPQAVTFHRCKDTSLIDQLRKLNHY